MSVLPADSKEEWGQEKVWRCEDEGERVGIELKVVSLSTRFADPQPSAKRSSMTTDQLGLSMPSRRSKRTIRKELSKQSR